jgi:hypothetical protein
MLLWLDGGLSTAAETHTQQHKGDFRVFVARKDLTIRLYAETMLQLKPQIKAHTCSLSALMPILKFLTVPDQLCISIQHPLSTPPF